MQFASEKYEAILKRISSSHEKSVELNKKLKACTEQLTSLSLLLKKDFPIPQAFRVLVKIYDSVYDLIQFHPSLSSELQSVSHLLTENKVYYTINIYISKIFKEKISGQNLYFNIKIENCDSCVCRTVPILYSKHSISSCPDVFIIIPFENPKNCDNVRRAIQRDVSEAVVDVSLLYDLQNRIPEIKIATIPIDFSYYFRDEKINDSSINRNHRIAQICRMYNPEEPKNFSMKATQNYQFPIEISKIDLFKIILQNSYHRVNPQKASVCTSMDNLIIVRLNHPCGTNSTVKLDVDAQKLSIETSLDKLPSFKSLIFGEGFKWEANLMKANLLKVKELKRDLKKLLQSGRVHTELLKDIVEALRQLIAAF